MHIDLTRPRFYTLCTKQLRICQDHATDILITSTLLILQFLIRFLNAKVGISSIHVHIFIGYQKWKFILDSEHCKLRFWPEIKTFVISTVNQMSCIPWFINLKKKWIKINFILYWMIISSCFRKFHNVIESLSPICPNLFQYKYINWFRWWLFFIVVIFYSF